MGMTKTSVFQNETEYLESCFPCLVKSLEKQCRYILQYIAGVLTWLRLVLFPVIQKCQRVVIIVSLDHSFDHRSVRIWWHMSQEGQSQHILFCPISLV